MATKKRNKAKRVTWKSRLDPFADKVYEIARATTEMETNDLRALVKACDKARTANIGWASYQIAPLVKSLAESVLHGRKRKTKAL